MKQETQTINTSVDTAVLGVDHGEAFKDMKDAMLIVSLFANAFIFTTWLTLQLTDHYNAAISAFLFN